MATGAASRLKKYIKKFKNLDVCTFRRFCSELGVEAESVVRFTSCGFERGLEFSSEQFLVGNTHTLTQVKNQTLTHAGWRVRTCAQEKSSALAD